MQRLRGKRILVTRASEQAGESVQLLRQYGAEPLTFPVIAIAPADGYEALDAALSQQDAYDWLIVTSVNTVTHLEKRLEALGLTWQQFSGTHIASIGPRTAGALAARGVQVAFMPSAFVSTALAEELPLQEDARVLLPRADIADKRLVSALRARGAYVDEFIAYRTIMPAQDVEALREELRQQRIDAVTLTSASTAHNLVALLGPEAPELLQHTALACIGPITAEAARQEGLTPTIIAEQYTIAGVLEALDRYWQHVSPIP